MIRAHTLRPLRSRTSLVRLSAFSTKVRSSQTSQGCLAISYLASAFFLYDRQLR